MYFPAYNPAASTNSDASARVEVACTALRDYTVYPNDGLFVLGGQPRMQNQWTAGYMNYDVYTDAGRTTKWNATNSFSGTGTGIGSYLTHTVYGRVPSSQGAADGSQDGPYVDYLTVTVEFN
jgi:spore coat protein U-like protein